MITAEVAKQQGYEFSLDNPYGYLNEHVNVVKTTDNKDWVYDIECYPDFFSVTFFPISLSKQLIKKYAKADMYNNTAKLIKTLRNMNVHIFTIRHGENANALLHFLEHNCLMLVGYNNLGYDDLMLNYMLTLDKNLLSEGYYEKSTLDHNYQPILVPTTITHEMYLFSNKLIHQEIEYSDLAKYKKNKQFNQQVTSLDVMALHRLDKLRISLKKCAITLKWYRIEDLPYEPGVEVATGERCDLGFLFNILTYNINDVLITKVAFDASRGEFLMRYGVSQAFDVDVLSLSRSATGDKILEQYYTNLSGKNVYQLKTKISKKKAVALVDVISYDISFETPIFQKLHAELLRTTVYAKDHPKHKKFEKNVIFDGHEYTMALGGLHSVDRPIIFKSDDKITYRDADVTSYYPNLMLNLMICPNHLDHNVFLPIIQMMLDKRVKAKRLAKDKSQPDDIRRTNKYINEGLKISVNNIFGKLGYHLGWLYDLRAMYKTTVNGQLMLFKLIEMLYLKGITTVSANTDGIICRIPLEKEEIYYSTCKEWEKLFNLNLEYNDYDKYLGTSVNDYIAITKDGDIKTKGDFVSNLKLDRGYSQPIVAKALYQYFVHGADIRSYINNCTNVHDFVYSQKIGKDMELHRQWVVNGVVHHDILQNTDRYYVSKSGSVIYKQYKEDSPNYRTKGTNAVKQLAIKKGEYVNIINDLTYNHPLTNVHRGFYIKEAYSILNKALRLDHKLISGTKSRRRNSGIGVSGISGTLFDDI